MKLTTEAINQFVAILSVQRKAKFQSDVSEIKEVTFFPSKFTDSLKSIHGPPKVSWTPV